MYEQYVIQDEEEYRGPITYEVLEEWQARENLIGITYGRDHFRNKLKAIAARSHKPDVGRALGQNWHCRTDKYGNPELLFAKEVILRFCVDGLRVRGGNWTQDQKKVSMFIPRLTNYVQNSSFYLNQSAQVLAKEAGYTAHESISLPLSIQRGCSCKLCKEYSSVIGKIQLMNDAIQKENERRKMFILSLRIDASDGPVLIPYGDKSEKTDYSFLPEFINRHWEKVQTARRWERKS